MAAAIPGRFRTFKPLEAELAQEFLERQLIPGEVRAGVPLETATSREVLRVDPRAGFWSRYPWMFKVDLVIEGPDVVTIVEVEEDLRLANLGKLLIYRQLYGDQYRPGKPVQLAVVARRDVPEMRAVLEASGVRVVVLERA